MKSSRAFSLVEVMVAAGISSLVLAGVLSTFLLMGRTGANVINYSDTEASARNALELVARDAHQAYGILDNNYSSTSLTLGIPDNTTDQKIPASPTANGAYKVRYDFDAANKRLTRAVNDGTPEVLATGVEQITNTPFIIYYKHVHASQIANVGEGYLNAVSNNNTTTNLAEIKQVEFSFLIKRKDVTVAAATNKVISARFILRNK